MTTLTQNVADISGTPDNAAWVFFTEEIRESDDGDAVITPRHVRVSPVDGVVTAEIDPGPAVVSFAGGTYSFTVPDVDSEIWPLIEAAVGIPANTPQQRLDAAVADYLTAHPPGGGGSGAWADITGKPAVIAAGATQTAARAVIGASAPMRPISAWYRPLRGLTTDIGVSVLAGDDPASSSNVYSATGKWRVCAGTIAALASDSAQGVNTCAGLGNSSSIGLNAFSIEFWSDATDLRFVFNNNTKRDFWVTVDDRLVAEYLLAANVADGMCTVYLTQPTAVLRKWRIGFPVAGWKTLSTNSGAKLVPTTKSFQLAFVAASLGHGVIVVANALGAGVSATLSANYPLGQLEQITGIDVWRMCHSGSGYLAQGEVANSTGPFGSTARMNALAALTGLDAIAIFTAGGNDLSVGGATVASVVAAAQANWTAVAAAQPGVPIIVVGCYRETNTLVGSSRDTLNTALKAAALAHASVTDFIDIFNDPPYTGTGYDGGPTGSGAADIMVSSDQTHPTFIGSKQFGQHLAAKLGRISIPVKAGA